MAEPKQVIIIRNDTEPKMRKGKMIAQGAHASMKVILDMMETKYVEMIGKNVCYNSLAFEKDSPLDKWINGIFTKVVVQASLDEMTDCYNKAKEAGIPCSIIEDRGLTEFGGIITVTACAIGPDEPEKINEITGHLKLL